MQKRSEILVMIEVGGSEIVTRVIERVDGGDEVFLGQGRAAVNDAMKNGFIVDERLMKQAICQSLEEAEPNARVSIRKVSLQHNGKIDMERLRQIVRSIPMEVCG